MAVYHLVANIEDLLSHNNSFLQDLFDEDGELIRKDLEERKKEGDIYVGSEGCKYFDPKLGCRCRFNETKEEKK